ncbi:hypothetical protein [Longimicrobium sp.]|uniref:hypothetical protein n=1 Tax=Longimicrobium sp. TaxID=2029185 RepID=UPI002E301576|nr:hypothetical protein [Longimicrobium sp.]HEX6040096.1 hypothetical protein [Longimicrobium sp.]
MLKPLALALLTASITLGACAAPAAQGGTSAPSASGSAAPARSDRDRLTRADIDATPGLATAYDAVQRLRPHWLRVTGARASDGQVAVYHNNTRVGGPEALRQIAIETVGSMRYLDAQDASNQLSGFNRPVGGAILVSTLRQ